MTIEPKHRIEGEKKVRGCASFVDDLRDDELGFSFLIGVPVTSDIATGRILSIDVKDALAVPGVVEVLTHFNAPKLKKVISVSFAEAGDRLPLQDRMIKFHGECIAVVVAGSIQAAREAAKKLVVNYDGSNEPANVNLASGQARLSKTKRAGIAPGMVTKGSAQTQYDNASIQIENVYKTAPYHHNSIEASSVIARWDSDGGVTVHAAVQWHHIDSMAIGQAFALGSADRLPGFVRRKILGHEFTGKVRLVNHLAGGAFGRNVTPISLFLACMAAKLVGQAVKLVLDTQDTFSLMSYRSEVEQRLKIGATDEGVLQSLIVEADVAVGAVGAYVEPVGSWSCQIYKQEAHFLQHRIARLDLNGTGWVRAPGGASAMFALETMMDELAQRVGVDPLEIRLRNYAEKDPESGKEWTTKYLRECYEEGAARIGWINRPKGGSLRPDGRLAGFGMATSYEPCFRFPATVGLELDKLGNLSVRATISELGQGLWTGLQTIAAEAMGFPLEKITLNVQDTNLPAGAGSIASTGAYSNGISLIEAAAKVKADLFAFVVADRNSPLHNLDTARLTVSEGIIWGEGGVFEAVSDVMKRYPKLAISKSATSGRDFGLSKTKKATFGAIFTEISVEPITGHVRVEKLIGAFDSGQVMNPTIVRSQLLGGMIWGLGHALFEQTNIDPRTGRKTNGNLGEAYIATHADIPHMEAVTIKSEREPGSPLFMKGVAEIGVIGVAPAVANAIYDATSIRLRNLPLKIDGRIPKYDFSNNRDAA